MAKIWGKPQCARDWELRNEISKARNGAIETECRNNNNNKAPKLGIKSTVMMVYAEKGMLAAWQKLQEYNEKLSGQGYTLEMLEQWIGEYEKKQTQRAGNDNGFGR